MHAVIRLVSIVHNIYNYTRPVVWDDRDRRVINRSRHIAAASNRAATETAHNRDYICVCINKMLDELVA